MTSSPAPPDFEPNCLFDGEPARLIGFEDHYVLGRSETYGVIELASGKQHGVIWRLANLRVKPLPGKDRIEYAQDS